MQTYATVSATSCVVSVIFTAVYAFIEFFYCLVHSTCSKFVQLKN